MPASAQPQCPVRTPRCHTRASWKSFRRPPPALAMSARISDATRHRAAVNLITPVNAPVIDPTIDQVNFPRRISVADRAAAATVGAKALCHSVHAIRARHIVEPVQTLATSSRSPVRRGRSPLDSAAAFTEHAARSRRPRRRAPERRCCRGHEADRSRCQTRGRVAGAGTALLHAATGATETPGQPTRPVRWRVARRRGLL